jgi:hypothetical protein
MDGMMRGAVDVVVVEDTGIEVVLVLDIAVVVELDDVVFVWA